MQEKAQSEFVQLEEDWHAHMYVVCSMYSGRAISHDMPLTINCKKYSLNNIDNQA